MLTKVKNRKLLIEISNPYSNEIQRREKVFYSTKHEGFGIGTASVAEVVQRMGGYVVFNTEEGIFKVNIFLPVKTVQKINSYCPEGKRHIGNTYLSESEENKYSRYAFFIALEPRLRTVTSS